MALKIISCVIVLAFAGIASAQSRPAPASTCIFNSTHCACSPKKTSGGACFRKQGSEARASLCSVDTCAAGGYGCDCLGKSLCKIDSCESYSPLDKSQTYPVGVKDVKCTLTKSGSCLTKLEQALPTPQPTVSPTPEPTPAPTPKPTPNPKEYKMVQVGRKQSDATLFNMPFIVDTEGEMLRKYQTGTSMHDSWFEKDKLKNRQLQFRLYEAPADAFNGKLSTSSSTVKYACMVINNYGGPNDGLGNYRAQTTITSLGEEIQFLQCDDMSECTTQGLSKTLVASHNGIVTHSDGLCVGPIDEKTGISVKVTGVQFLEGINFLGGDGTENEFGFQDGGGIGMTGKVDTNGLVVDGDVPEIVIRPGGILKEYTSEVKP